MIAQFAEKCKHFFEDSKKLFLEPSDGLPDGLRHGLKLTRPAHW